MLTLFIKKNINTSTFKDVIASFAQKEKQYMLREHDQVWSCGIYHTYIKNIARFSIFYAVSGLMWCWIDLLCHALEVQLLTFFIHTKKSMPISSQTVKNPHILAFPGNSAKTSWKRIRSLFSYTSRKVVLKNRSWSKENNYIYHPVICFFFLPLYTSNFS